MTQILTELEGVDRSGLCSDRENARSVGLPARLGYTREGILRHRAQTPDGNWRDTESWPFVDGDELL